MPDQKSTHERLLINAADCELIGSLSVDAAPRATFRRLAAQFRDLALKVKAEMARGIPTALVSDSEFLLQNAKEIRELAFKYPEESIRTELLRMAKEFEDLAET